jgi:hypothetical protein
MVLVNEAPYKVRRSNVGLVVYGMGIKKNPRSVLLNPVVDSLNQIRRDGFMVDQIRYFIQPTITTVDSVERCEMNNTSRLMGKAVVNGDCIQVYLKLHTFYFVYFYFSYMRFCTYCAQAKWSREERVFADLTV